MLQRILAIVAMRLLAGTGVAMMAALSPATAGLISAASAQEDDDGDDDDDDDDDGQAPAGGIATGHGGTATAAQQDDDDDDDDGQVPAGGIATGQGGTAESWTADTFDRLHELAVRTLVVAGELDIVTPPRYGRVVAERIPNAEFVVLPGEAHQPFQECPAEFNARVDGFWSKVEGSG